MNQNNRESEREPELASWLDTDTHVKAYRAQAQEGENIGRSGRWCLESRQSVAVAAALANIHPTHSDN